MPNLAPRRAPARRAPARRAAVRVAALLPTVLLGACGGGDDATGPGSVAGTYSLQSVNEQPLPMLLGQDDGGVTYYIASGSVELRSDKRYTSTLTFRLSAGGQSQSQSQQDAGTYTVSGSSVTFRSDDDGSSTVATVNGGQLTNRMPLDGGGVLTFVFQK